MGFKAAVVGASGFAGAELVRILLGHPAFELSYAVSDSQAGEALAKVYPAFTGHTDMAFTARKDVDWSQVDVAFLAVPHTASMKMTPKLLKKGIVVIDLSADFRLKDPETFERYYKVSHVERDILAGAFFGQPELDPLAMIAAKEAYERKDPVLVACAGCYPTASSLAATPAIRGGLVLSGATVVVDAISGVTGAGRTPSDRTHFCTANENVSVYGLLEHRHTPEMEQIMGLDGAVLFTPHLAPLDRGILSTVTMPVDSAYASWEPERFSDMYAEFYRDSRFVHVLADGQTPQTSAVRGTNEAHLCVTYSQRTGMLLAICAIDNLCKGAAGQAVQCANIVLGLDEDAGLAQIALPV